MISRSAIAGLDFSAGTGFVNTVSEGVAKWREVKASAISGELVEIVAGLKSGEQYVVRGGFNPKDGDTVVVAK